VCLSSNIWWHTVTNNKTCILTSILIPDFPQTRYVCGWLRLSRQITVLPVTPCTGCRIIRIDFNTNSRFPHQSRTRIPLKTHVYRAAETIAVHVTKNCSIDICNLRFPYEVSEVLVTGIFELAAHIGGYSTYTIPIAYSTRIIILIIPFPNPNRAHLYMR